MADETETTNGRASIREVRDLVQGLRDDVGEWRVANERRLTQLEERQRAHVEALAATETRLQAHGRAIGELKDSEREDRAATAALSRSASRRIEGKRWLIDSALTLGIIVATVVAVFH